MRLPSFLQMALKSLVIEAFVPPDEVQKVTRRAEWDEEKEQWILERLSEEGRREQAGGKRPVSASNIRRPTSDFAKVTRASTTPEAAPHPGLEP